MLMNRWVYLLTLLSILCLPSVGLAEIGGLAVFDDNGKRIGPVVGLRHGNPATFPDVLFSFETNNILVTLLVSKHGTDLFGLGGGVPGGPSPFYFESTDCSGTPLMAPSTALWLNRIYVGGPNPGQLGGGGDNIIYRTDPNDTPRDVFPSSQANATGEDCDPPGVNKIQVVNADPVLDIDTVFTRPFHIESEDVPDLNELEDKLDNHYHKLKLGRRFRLPTGPAIFSDSQPAYKWRGK